MDKRSYNIFFHLHTVTGIVISVLLYVIFFAGSFSFFRDDIIAWERNEPVEIQSGFNLDLNTVLDTLDQRHGLTGRDISFHKHPDEKRYTVNISASKDTLKAKDDLFFYFDPENYKEHDYEKSYTLGEFLYRLHFFAQIPYPAGYYLSGFTSLFFLFAILTGILVHWRKIISNFYVFRPREKLKTVWTDAHTVLGTIGLPFQVVYAVTGAFFMINIFLVIPSLVVLFDGDQKKFYGDLGYGEPEYACVNTALTKKTNVNDLVVRTNNLWKDMEIDEVHIHNYDDQGMYVTVSGELNHAVKFTGLGAITYKASTLEVISQKNPYEKTPYLDGVKGALYHLHFGDYGGYAVKSISFVLGLISCFVIITGILIWLEARNKKSVPENEKRFNERVGNIYLAICLTMFPVTALAFIITKLVPDQFDDMRMTILYSVYFGTWLLSTLFFIWKKNNYFTNKYTLLSGAILGLLIPVIQGLVTGNWLWHSWTNGQRDLFITDFIWIAISGIALYTVSKLTNQADTQDVLITAEPEA